MRNVLPLSPMTADEYEKLPSGEKEHFAECARCGEIFDRRSLDEVLFHIDHKHRPDIQYSGSIKLD
jgi:hypothetical protein